MRGFEITIARVVLTLQLRGACSGEVVKQRAFAEFDHFDQVDFGLIETPLRQVDQALVQQLATFIKSPGLRIPLHRVG